MDPHPGHGPRDPTLSTPGRISGSVRRTSTMDCHWPDGLGGDVRVIGRARDLVTDEAGEGRPVDQAVLDAEIRKLCTPVELSIEIGPFKK